jgi:NAD(P)-dependent dehydrogenase (short-subunit alcohol dehydrogenase family)
MYWHIATNLGRIQPLSANMELLNKVIVITGATSGIGHATALLLASKGAKLGLLDIMSPKGVEEEIAAAGGQATAYQCDVRLSEQVESVIRQIVEKYGPLHGSDIPQ